jgi:2-polyprenyl-3-methyl-5-hydroxy-6-metoxy-1,4-benzoquinol methylase
MERERLSRARARPVDVLSVDARLEHKWAAAHSGTVLDEVATIAALLPLPRMIEWSTRLRSAGRSPECPLMTIANDSARSLNDQVVAAGSAWQHFRDPRAATAMASLVGKLGALERLTAQQLAPDLVEALPGYYLHARPEILERIPVTASSLLELGCAAGVLGQTVKARQKCRYVGVELDPDVARIAANGLDEALVLNLDSSKLPFGPGSFDCAVCADVLEHLRDPWEVLSQVHDLLQPGGQIVVSIPNIRNLGVMADLAAGDWVYQDAGILDRTHLRFFTLRSFGRALAGAGFEISSINSVFEPSLQAAMSSTGGQTLRAKHGQLQIDGLSAQDALELATVQFLFVASRPVRPGS